MLPEKIDYGQVLVKIKFSGICGSQINEIDAVKGIDRYLPHLLGHEGSGIVIGIGKGVSTVKKGDRVVLHWRKGAGIESEAPKYFWKKKILNAGKVTTFNQTALVSENRVTKIPNNFDMLKAPLFGCAVTTAFGVINYDAKLKIGQSIVIVGLGGVGLNIVQAAKLVSGNPIIGIDINNIKLKMAKKLGLTHGILIKKGENFESKVRNILKSSNADVVIDTTGNSKIIESAYNLTNSLGKTILVGVPNKKVKIYTLPLHFDKILKGSHGGSSRPDLEIPRYIKLIESKKMTLNNLITHKFNLKDINKAISLFRSGKCGRIIIKM
jgi:S-(hydroxymethyl)glutathione dehydrogenase/alcohol dehydrogenase